MKKVLALVAATGILAAASFASAGSIINSKHDLGSASTNGGIKGVAGTNTSQICIYCHSPHGSIQSIPLWNRTNPTASSFTLYSGVNMASVSFKSGFTSDSTSLFCMSCHDGGTSMSAVHNAGPLVRNSGLGMSGSAGLALYGATIGGSVGHSGNLSSDLSTTHPVNFPVDLTNKQGDLWVAAANPTTMGGGIATGATISTFPLFKTKPAGNATRTTDSSLECGSCHAVHDSAISPFLRLTMEGSKLCLGCHNK